MSLASITARHEAALRAFGGKLTEETSNWQDRKFDEIRNDSLQPLMSENERFLDDMREIDQAIARAMRRLNEPA